MSRLKILFHLNSLEQGGAERVVTTLANCLIKEYDVIIATMWTASEEYEIDERIRRVSVGLSPAQQNRGRLQKIYYRNHNLRLFLEKEKPDLVISFAKKANYRALIATIGMKVPVIVSVRTNPYSYYSRPFDKILIPVLYGRASGNVFQTEGARKFFPLRIQKKSKIILNPLNPKYLGISKSVTRKKEVVQSGRIDSIKNQKMLIEAFLSVHEKHPDYVLKLYGMDSGDGTKEELLKCIEKNRAEDFVLLMGNSNQLEKDIVNASVYAFSSNWEGLPNSVMEAMALGLPVVSTDCPCGGPATLIENEKNGLLVPVGDRNAMAGAICRLIEDRMFAETLADNAQKIVRIADPELICRQWKDYISEVLKNK